MFFQIELFFKNATTKIACGLPLPNILISSRNTKILDLEYILNKSTIISKKTTLQN